jgi:glycosyltransferase involved in cell wall biosynthesis
MKPLVSVIIPCYNAERWVADSVASALAQTWPEIEVIAVNDGSSDGSLEVLKRISGPRVRVIDQPNRGASAARNTGLREARGAFIQFLDADDLLTSGKIAEQVALLESQGTEAVATTRWARFTRDPANAYTTESPLFRDLSPVDFLLLYAAGGHMMHPAAWLVPSSVAKNAGPWNESLSLNDDGEYFSRVVMASKRILHAPDSLTFYRSYVPNSLSGRRDRRSLDSLYRSFELVAHHLSGAENSPRVHRALADCFQRLVYEVYPEAPDLSSNAAVRVKEFGGSELPPQMGRRQALLARFVGWKLAKRIARNLT